MFRCAYAGTWWGDEGLWPLDKGGIGGVRLNGSESALTRGGFPRPQPNNNRQAHRRRRPPSKHNGEPKQPVLCRLSARVNRLVVQNRAERYGFWMDSFDLLWMTLDDRLTHSWPFSPV